MTSALALNVAVDAQAAVLVDNGSVVPAPPNSLLTFSLASPPAGLKQWRVDASVGGVVVGSSTQAPANAPTIRMPYAPGLVSVEVSDESGSPTGPQPTVRFSVLVDAAREAASPVRVNADGSGGALASPYAAVPGDYVVVDSSTGSVVVNLPALALGEKVRVKHDENTSLASNSVTVNGPAGVNLAEAVPNNGTFAASVSFGAGYGGQNDRGSDFTWRNAGSGGGYVLE